jgi:hypothetical protein
MLPLWWWWLWWWLWCVSWGLTSRRRLPSHSLPGAMASTVPERQPVTQLPLLLGSLKSTQSPTCRM